MTEQREYPISVLAVDDDIGMLELYQSVLEYGGFKVKGTTDAQSIYGQPDQVKADVVLIDLMMPGIDGINLAGKIREINPNLAIIIISAAIHGNFAEELIKQNNFSFVKKPFDIDELIEVIRREVGLSRKLAANQLKLVVVGRGWGEVVIGSEAASPS